jgi:uncharacterized protein YaaN involved in tellurite resistance|tara:strand:- start:2892 stop:3134 length:243 start_codon:yes stop_codon:yes gene_type:complete
MDELTLISKVQKRLKENLQAVGDAMLTGTGVDNHEKYKYLLGQAHAIQLTLQEISNLLKTKEQHDSGGNIVDIKKGSPKA